MALINRLSRLVKADFHAVLDQIEEPEQLLRQAIRDMEDDLAESERRVTGCANDQEVLAVRKRELDASLAEIDEQLDLCFASGKEGLARSLIRRKLETGRLLKRLNSQFTANAKFLEEQRAALDENSATLNRLRQKAELFAQRSPASVGGDSVFDDTAWVARDMIVGDDEVEIAFLREKNLRGES